MKIEVEIFDDGFDPPTCARDFTNRDQICPFLMTERFGTIESCRLFSTSYGSAHEREARALHTWGRDQSKGFLRPVDDCLRARGRSECIDEGHEFHTTEGVEKHRVWWAARHEEALHGKKDV